ncbi:MAG: SpoIIE family protein phosphatase, partial [Gammaproteobacteria bacterium]
MSILFKKTLLLMVAMFGLIAIVTSISIGQELYKAMTDEYRSKGIAITKGIATSSVEMILTRDASTIQATIDQYLDIRGVLYVFVVNDEQEVISHTFVPAVPAELADFQQLENNKNTQVRTLTIENVGTVMDISEPILSGLIGYVHVGMDTGLIKKAFWHAMIKQQAIILVIFVFCAFAAYLLVGRISSPLVHLTKTTHRLARHDFLSASEFKGEKDLQKITSKDEIGDLADAFRTLITELHRSIKDLKETTAVKERIESELKIATDIQASLLPRTFPPFPDHPEFEIYASMVPAKEVAGDFYDFFFIDETNLCFLVADVSDKGVPAALYMMVAKTLLKTEGQRLGEPDEILFSVNNILAADNESCMFTTVFCAILDITTGEVRFANAGHNKPLIIDSQGVRYLPVKPGLMLGPKADMAYVTERITLKPGDALFLYTDGVTEARNRQNELYGELRLQNALQSAPKDSLTELIHFISAELSRYAIGVPQSDDITMLAIKVTGT